MGGVLIGVLGSSRALRGRPALTGKEGMIGEVGAVRSPVGVESAGWVFVHGERGGGGVGGGPVGEGPPLAGKEGRMGEVGAVRSPVGVESAGWVFVHGERWRAVLAFAPEGADPTDGEPTIGVGRKVTVVGFNEEGTVQVVPAQGSYDQGSLNSK